MFSVIDKTKQYKTKRVTCSVRQKQQRGYSEVMKKDSGARLEGSLKVNVKNIIQKVGEDAVSGNRSEFTRDYIRKIEKGIYPFLKVCEEPNKYPYYMGDAGGFDSTALPETCNPIIAVHPCGRFDLLHLTSKDGKYVESSKPVSDGGVYREFNMKGDEIISLADYKLGGGATLSEGQKHCDLGYLGIRKVKLVGEALKKELGRFDETQIWSFYRQLDVEEQGLSTNLNRDNAKFMPGCRMHRLSLAAFLERFPFGDSSPLIADWDYGLAQDVGHVDIKLNPLWLAKNKPWKGRMIDIDANFYRDTLNDLLRENKDLWENVH